MSCHQFKFRFKIFFFFFFKGLIELEKLAIGKNLSSCSFYKVPEIAILEASVFKKNVLFQSGNLTMGETKKISGILFISCWCLLVHLNFVLKVEQILKRMGQEICRKLQDQ